MPNAKRIEWYYGDRGKIVGPLAFEDIAGRINRAPNEKHLVWTDGMTRWSDARTIATFTDCFRANPPPLPAPSLSPEDEFWIKPGSRASPPPLPVPREPRRLRDRLSAIGKTPSDPSPQVEHQPWQWRREVKHLGSTVAFFLGGLAFVGAASRIANGDPIAPGVAKAGLVLMLGALVYRSVKRRRLGEVASMPARRVLEVIAIALMFLSVLLL